MSEATMTWLAMWLYVCVLVLAFQESKRDFPEEAGWQHLMAATIYPVLVPLGVVLVAARWAKQLFAR